MKNIGLRRAVGMMRKHTSPTIASILVLASTAVAQPPKVAAPLTAAKLAAVLQKVSGSVVLIERGEGGKEDDATVGVGSFIGEGLVLTSDIVLDRAPSWRVVTRDGARFSAGLSGRDKRSHLCVMKVAAQLPFKPLTLSGFADLELGQQLILVGATVHSTTNATTGVVRGLQVNLPGLYIPGGVIQVDAAVTRGSVGGPLLDLNGELVGVVFARQGVGDGALACAIPLRLVGHALPALKTGKPVEYAWIGIQMRQVAVTPAQGARPDETTGIAVAGILPDSPAAAGRIKVGDVIVRFDGRRLLSAQDLALLCLDASPGQSIDIEVLRNGKRLTLSVRLGRAPEQITVPQRPAGP